MNLGNTIVQVRSIARGLSIGDDAAQESWFVASYRRVRSLSLFLFVLLLHLLTKAAVLPWAPLFS